MGKGATMRIFLWVLLALPTALLAEQKKPDPMEGSWKLDHVSCGGNGAVGVDFLKGHVDSTISASHGRYATDSVQVVQGIGTCAISRKGRYVLSENIYKVINETLLYGHGCGRLSGKVVETAEREYDWFKTGPDTFMLQGLPGDTWACPTGNLVQFHWVRNDKAAERLPAGR